MVKVPIFVEKNSMRKALIAASVLVLLIFTLIFFYFKQDFSVKNELKLFAFVPEQAAIIIEFKNDKSLYELYEGQSIANSILTDEYREELRSVNALFFENPYLESALASKTILASVFRVRADKAGILYVSEIDGKAFEDPAKIFEAWLSPKNTLQKRNYDNQVIWQINFSASRKVISICKMNDVLLVSYTPTLIEDAIRQRKSGRSVVDDSDFKQGYQSLGKQSVSGVYINYKYIGNYIESFTKRPVSALAMLVNALQAVSILELNYKTDAWMLSGHSVIPESENSILQVLKNQSPQKHQLVNYISMRTAGFVHLGFSDYALYLSDLNAFMGTTKNPSRREEIRKIDAKYGLSIEQELLASISKEMLITANDNVVEEFGEDILLFVSLKDAERMRQVLGRIQEHELRSVNIPNAEIHKDYIIRPNFLTKIGLLAFGPWFGETQYHYYLMMEDRLIFARDKKALELYIDDYISLQLLSGQKTYQEFLKGLSDQSNLFFYGNLHKASMLLRTAMNDYAEGALLKQGKWSSYNAFALQMYASNDRFFTSIYMPLLQEEKNELRMSWKYALDAPANAPPYIIENHDTHAKEIIIQDEDNQLYLFNASGKLIWKIPINGKIISGIYQVDYYKNGKLQLLFNSEKQLYLIDRNGKFMPNYPIRLSTDATTGLALFDYDKNKNYRIFISCTNRSIFGYDISGRPLDGWNPKANVGHLQHPMQHVSVGGKDYLFVNNTNGDFYFFNRRGDLMSKFVDTAQNSYNNPFIFDANESFAKNRFINTDTKGKIRSVFLDGRRLYKTVGVWSSDHFFNYANIAGDTSPEYIFLDRNHLFVYGDDSSIVFNYQFTTNIDLAPQLIERKGNKYMLGVTARENNQIFLFKEDGNLYEGFPLAGSTHFRLAELKPGGKKYLIVGSSDKNLYVYELQE